MVEGKYEIQMNGEILRYPIYSSLGSDTTTKGIRVRANALLIPEMCNFETNEFFFAYRISKT